jgi:putative copper export protein/methionine-rich copper-binding protein CopC
MKSASIHCGACSFESYASESYMKQAQNVLTETKPATNVTRRRHRSVVRVLIASFCAITLLLLLSGVASAHALLDHSIPAQGAILDQDQVPSKAQFWFTEELNPALSKVIVVDQNNHEVDRQNSHVSSSNPKEIDLGLPKLGPGAYVVIWRTVSADDGHAAGGSFIFRVRFPDNTVPAIPGQLPTGPAGFGSTNTNQCLVGPAPFLCLPQVLSEWIVFATTAIWVGGLFWLVYIVEGTARRDSRLVPTAITTARRFRRGSFLALTIFFIVNIGYIMGQVILAGGGFGSAFSATIWSGIILHSRFGLFWLLREIVALLVLLLLALLPERQATPENWRPPTLARLLSMLGALCLLVAMAFSGHAAAAEQAGSIKAFAVPVDWLHLLAMSLWVGGLLFIALMLFPTTWNMPSTERAYAWTTLMPRFSLIALVSVAVAALSGSYNTGVHLTSWNQFLDTAYGRTLIVKILIFCVMIGISALHAFRIRPAISRELKAWGRLQGAGSDGAALALANRAATEQREDVHAEAEATREEALSASRQQSENAARGASGKLTPRTAQPAQTTTSERDLSNANGNLTDQSAQEDGYEPEEASSNGTPVFEGTPQAHALGRIESLSERLRFWVRQEALLGIAVLLCASLLGGLAGTLTPATPGSGTSVPTITATSKTPVDMTQTKDGLQVTFKVAPDTFGPNSFGVVLVDATTGQPIDGANVHLVSTMLDMDMGTQTLDLKGQGSGFYLGQGDLTMGGNWQVVVQVRVPSDPTTIHRFTFQFKASY